MTYWDRQKTLKGDLPGHPFRGNQYTDEKGHELSQRLERDMARVDAVQTQEVHDQHQVLQAIPKAPKGMALTLVNTERFLRQHGLLSKPLGWDGKTGKTMYEVHDTKSGKKVRLSGEEITRKLRKGDLPGHPFRGNQYTSGVGHEPLRLDALRDANKALTKHIEARDRHYRMTERYNYTHDAYQNHLAAAERHSEAVDMYQKAIRTLHNNKDVRVGLRAFEKAKERGKLASHFSGSAKRGEMGSWFGM